MKKNNTIIRKLVAVSLATMIGFTSLAIGQASTAEAATASQANKIVSIGDNYLGVPYRFGAKSGITSAFDCSSFTQYVYKKVGIYLPRTSKQQSKVGSYVSRSNLKKGDLVFFSVGSGKGVAHVAIYVGNNKILHTYGEGGVKFSQLNSKHWSSHYITARRVS
ncbi:C40 family peptidase [Paenibacillus spongiae]|uniref:C40 family peptidase n=1 Tax=Paenibacillus spongiae TaxID=2909671 RepID=A0ABY5S1C7_9BACL|nr:C40 family peptidase [Paenibacillus spongiae]UVI27669.1 C40 family peptidase [Paenibacillus spongiae]